MKFSEWLAARLAERSMRAQDLANYGDIDPATVSSILNDRREVGPEVARKMAKALELPQWVVLFAAGILTEEPDYVNQPMPPVIASIVRDLKKADEKDQRLLQAMVRTLTSHLAERNDTPVG
jgi:transcriptional regulator with XRE-family HTH domain